MRDSVLTVPWFFVTYMRAITTDYTKRTYHMNFADALLMHRIACNGFKDGHTLAPGNNIVLENL